MTFRVGDIVRVRGLSGSPDMVVTGDDDPLEAGRVVVRWWDRELRANEQVWQAALLERATPEGIAEPLFDEEPTANAIAAKAYEDRVKARVLHDLQANADRFKYAHTEGVIDDDA